MKKAKFVLSKSKLLEQYNKIEKICNIISYSSKTNPIITKILEEKTDCWFSIHLKNELKNVKAKSRVLFLAQGWDQNLIQELFDFGINKFVIDNESDLEELLRFLDKNDEKIILFLRMKLRENTIKTEKYFVFGMNHEIINKRIKELKNNSKILKLGLHFHRKTQNISEWDLKYEISNIIEDEVLEIIDYINIGGGIPSNYANTNEDVIKSVFDKIKELRGWLKNKNIELIIEPGRYISASSCKLITHIKCIHEKNIIVNASVYNSDLDALIVPVKLIVEGELPKNQGHPYVIKGITPCSMDLFRYRVYLNNPKVGDDLIFLNAGAYNFTTDFCDLEKLETEIID
ncbi:MAG: decarboxylase [Candidatus Nanoarchaeia archaeon]|jgi:ornithine decarboxylase|nr:decarboxylase [Candidatus Nanoarchaeia archaeon]|tara:strand:- start:28140 stop:29174 length:1035 start_codon:yes stop_codon:yes gene_type:complete